MSIDSPLSLVVGAARSGTTLTRRLLDAHPDITCPSEAGIPALMAHMAQVWVTSHADDFSDDEARAQGLMEAGEQVPAAQKGPADGRSYPIAPESARLWMEESVSGLLRQHLHNQQAHIYCDKSLDSVFHLALVQQVFPKSRSILIFRHVMDTIASGLEASPYGFRGYGYAPYVQSFPGNWVAALASYWLDHVTAARQWQEQHPESCFALRYEDLTADPGEAIARCFRFLGVRDDAQTVQTVLTSAFRGPPSRGPGDHKIEFTNAVHSASVGRGKRVPVTLLPEPLLASLNVQLTGLGYGELDASWNVSERVSTPQGGFAARELTRLMNQGLGRVLPADDPSFGVVADDDQALRWCFLPGLPGVQGDAEVESVVTGSTQDLLSLLQGSSDVGLLLRSGRLRHVVPGGAATEAEAASVFARIVSFLGDTVT